MSNYPFRSVRTPDYENIAGIYNSNPAFLRSHLGMDEVDAAFIAEECREMQEAGFESCVIEAAGQAIGVLDYRSGAEVYLSLLMLRADRQGKGAGSAVYAAFEEKMRREGASSIRIDVVNGYSGNLVPFWQGKGFSGIEEIMLDWGKKTNRALVMKKTLGKGLDSGVEP